jgi:hypothetical protein
MTQAFNPRPDASGEAAWAALDEVTVLADRALQAPDPLKGIQIGIIALVLTLQTGQDNPPPAAPARALRRTA